MNERECKAEFEKMCQEEADAGETVVVCTGRERYLTAQERDELGHVVRNAWVRWASTQPNPKPSWLTPWSELIEPDREAYRRIADELVAYLRLPGMRMRVVDNCTVE
jgi:hypothetical protein